MIANKFPYFYFFIASIVVGVIFVHFFFSRDYNQLLTKVKGTLVDFSQEKEKLVSQFLVNNGENLYFKDSQNLVNTIVIADGGGQEISLDSLRETLYVQQQQKLRLNAYLVNDQGALLTAQKEFDTSSTRLTTKIIRNELISKCLNSDNSNSNFYTGIDEGNRSVFGTYQKVSSLLPLCLFSETEKVTNIDIPAQQILKQYIFLGLFFVIFITILGWYFSCFSSLYNLEEIILFILCGVAVFSYSFLVTYFIRGVNYFSPFNYLLDVVMATFSFSLLIIDFPFNKGKFFRTGAFLLGIYFLLTIFFEEYRQMYALSSVTRNLILVLMRGLSITGFLSLFFNFKKIFNHE